MPKGFNIQILLHVLIGLAAVLAVGFVGVQGWQWQRTLQCERITIEGAHHADHEALLALAQVDTGMVLFDIDPTLTADRLRRHPWVRDASVARLPTGTLSITVAERGPVVLALDAQGRPAYYLDGRGFRMPVVQGAAYDVPLLHGLREPYHPVQPVQQEEVQELLRALAEAPWTRRALLSELELRSEELWGYTTPAGAPSSIPVRLGRAALAEKLARLDAFWQQAVLTQQHKRFERIDLRFDGQVVTQETIGDLASPNGSHTSKNAN